MTDNPLQGLPSLDELLNRDSVSESTDSYSQSNIQAPNKVIIVAFEKYSLEAIHKYNPKARPLSRTIDCYNADKNDGFITYLRSLSNQYRSEDIVVIYWDHFDKVAKYLSDKVSDLVNISFVEKSQPLAKNYIDLSCKFRSF